MAQETTQERRKPWKLKFAINFLNWSLALICAFVIVSFYILIRSVAGLHSPAKWQTSLIIFQLCFSAGVIFSFLGVIFLVLHRALGPVPRIERLLDKVLAGDYSQRMGVRDKDILYTFVSKVNKLIEMLDQKNKR